jgi:rhodanese-related sulfurtransferase
VGIVVAGILIALLANAVSPRGIPLVGDFTNGAALANLTEKELKSLPSQVDAEAVERAIAADSALVLDARLPEDYAAGHIPGAFNLSVDRYETAYPALADTLKSAARLIVYCDGGDCELSHDLASMLKEQGHAAVQLFADGISGWIEAGKELKEGKEP